MPRAPRKSKNPVPVNMPGPAVNVPPAIEAELAAAYRAEQDPGAEFLHAENVREHPEAHAAGGALLEGAQPSAEVGPAEWDEARITAVRERIQHWEFGAPVERADLVALHDVIRVNVREFGLDGAVDITHRERDGEVVAEIFPIEGGNVPIMRQHYRVIVPEAAPTVEG